MFMQARTSPPDSFVDCSNYTATLGAVPAGEYPALEAMLCALVLQGAPAAAAPDAAPGAADPPAAAVAPDDVPAADDAGTRGVVGDTDSAPHSAPPLLAAALVATAFGAVWL